MATSPILFFTEKISFSLPKPAAVSQWLEQVAAKESKQLKQLSYIFCSDDYLHAMNVRYLEHDTLTDVITFDQSEQAGVIEGDVYVSIDRVRENAQTYAVPFTQELYRVMVHGLLHLIGYADKQQEERLRMRAAEDTYLAWING